MNREDIIRMAREAFIKRGFWPNEVMWECWKNAWLEGAATEREACAKVCDDQSKEFGGVAKGPFVTDFGKHTQMSMAAGAENCAAAIRARGNT